MDDLSARQCEVIAHARYVQFHERELVATITGTLQHLSTVLVPIANERHHLVPEGSHNKGRRQVEKSLSSVNLQYHAVCANVHFTVGTGAGDIVHLRAAIHVVNFAAEYPGNRLALRRIQFLRSRKSSQQRVYPLSNTLDMPSKPGDRRGIANHDSGPDLFPLCEPAVHLLRTGVERIELVHASQTLAKFKFPSGHLPQLLIETPNKRHHVARLPPRLKTVAKRARIARVEVGTRTV